jgi:hypothetical protein
MPELVPGRKYTFEELARFREDPAYAKWAAAGYVWEQDLDGTLKLVHWSKSILDNEVKNPRGYVDSRSTEDIFPTEPIAKRTPQERKDSLIKRWWDACRKAGTVPGLTDEQLTHLFGREWKTGVSEITYADIERMAAVMLNEAENKAK